MMAFLSRRWVECETVWPDMENGKMKSARVAMGPATFTAEEVPVDTASLGGIEEVISRIHIDRWR